MRSDLRILMCYNKRPTTPGRYLEDGLRDIGVRLDIHSMSVNFRHINIDEYTAILFVESPSCYHAEVTGIEHVSIPKLFWVHHGGNRLADNLRLCRVLRPDVVFMAHSLQLAKRFPARVEFLPFAAAPQIFNCSRPHQQRTFDIAFVGRTSAGVYKTRRRLLREISRQLGARAKLSLNATLFVHDLAARYGDSKIVVNCAADRLRSINMRLFEGMGCGALVVTDLVPDQDALFTDRLHYVTFRGIQGAIDQLAYYLAHPSEAQAIAAAGHNHVLAHHTYRHRARTIVAEIRNLIK